MSSSIGPRVAACLFTLAAFILSASSAAAVPIVDRDLAVRFGDAEGDVCVLVPASLWDPAACAGIDRSTLGVRATAVDADIVALAILRQDGWGVVLAIVRDDVSAGLLERSGAGEWLEGLRRGIRGGLAPGARFTLAATTVTNVNGVRVVGTEMNVDPPPGESARGFLGFAAIDGVVTRGGTYVVTFASSAEHAVETRRIAAATLLTLRAKPAKVAESAYRLARTVGLSAATIVVVPAALTALVLLVRRAGRRRRASSGTRTLRMTTPPSSFRVPPSLFTQRLRLAPDLALAERDVPFRALIEGVRTLPSNPRNAAALRPK
jgi:hypothetical protein